MLFDDMSYPVLNNNLWAVSRRGGSAESVAVVCKGPRVRVMVQKSCQMHCKVGLGVLVTLLLLTSLQLLSSPVCAGQPPQGQAGSTAKAGSAAKAGPVAEAPKSVALPQPAGSTPTLDSASGFSRNAALLSGLTVFVLAVFLGFEVITKVPPMLHTPLMSGSNAISGITVVGALLAAGKSMSVATLLGTLALVLATINVVGGFMVTGRMLAMFQQKKDL